MQTPNLCSLGLLLLMLAAGCQSPGDPGHSAAVPPQRATDDLPRDKAAEACLVTAHELDRIGYASEAINEYERAKELNPLFSSVISRRLAVLYDRRGDDARALAAYQVALQEFHEDSDFLNDVGFFYVSRNNGAQAERWLQEAVRIDPKSSRSWVNLGTALAEQRKYSQSYDAYVRVLPAAQAWSNVGMIEAQQGDYRLAVASLTHATDADPTLLQTRAALLWAQKRLVSIYGQPSK